MAKQDVNLVDGNPQNQTHSNAPRTRSHIDFSYKYDFTPVFGRITPFMHMQAVPADKKLRYQSSISVDSMNLKSPVLSDIRVHKNYFQIPMEAILPLNWELIYANPVRGDDVPSSANCTITLETLFILFKQQFCTFAPNGTALVSIATKYNVLAKQLDYLKMVVVLEHCFNNSSLQAALGYNLQDILVVHPDTLIGNVPQTSFEGVCGKLISLALESGIHCRSSSDGTDILFDETMKNEFRDYVLSHLDCTMQVNEEQSWLEFTKCKINVNFSAPDYTSVINLANLFAYQLVCFHFYTNDKVDFVFSANLYRQLMSYLPSYVNGGATFSYNGIDMPFDYLSAEYVSPILSEGVSSLPVHFLQYIMNIFGYHNSLRYQDYFTGARTQPLALGDTSVAINSANEVSVLDVTKKLQTQRFLNEVNRSGRKFGKYIKSMFNQDVAPDWHNPKWLSSSVDNITSFNTRNTSDAQQTQANSTTSNFTMNSNRFEFEIEVDRPSIIMGLLSFDITRMYPHCFLRENMIKDRFDMFNPFFQFIGDQEVFAGEYNMKMLTGKSELGTLMEYGMKSTFGYQTRNMEYKQNINRCSGAFKGALKSWIYTNDNLLFDVPHITPAFIRSYPSELDKYYTYVEVNNMSDYFHFIITCFNKISVSRPMAFNPQIL